MKKPGYIILLCFLIGLFMIGCEDSNTGVSTNSGSVDDTHFSDNAKGFLPGNVYSLDKDDKYELSKAQSLGAYANRILLKGGTKATTAKNSFATFEVSDGNIEITIDSEYAKEQLSDADSSAWHIVND